MLWGPCGPWREPPSGAPAPRDSKHVVPRQASPLRGPASPTSFAGLSTRLAPCPHDLGLRHQMTRSSPGLTAHRGHANLSQSEASPKPAQPASSCPSCRKHSAGCAQVVPAPRLPTDSRASPGGRVCCAVPCPLERCQCHAIVSAAVVT